MQTKKKQTKKIARKAVRNSKPTLKDCSDTACDTGQACCESPVSPIHAAYERGYEQGQENSRGAQLVDQAKRIENIKTDIAHRRIGLQRAEIDLEQAQHVYYTNKEQLFGDVPEPSRSHRNSPF
tara:strand:+ start:1957 stop:2328 length:372 start_codon:yes stop_codon:yes gene_type:complete